MAVAKHSALHVLSTAVPLHAASHPAVLGGGVVVGAVEHTARVKTMTVDASTWVGVYCTATRLSIGHGHCRRPAMHQLQCFEVAPQVAD